MLNGRRLAWTLAFVVLITVAVGAGCRGFFQNPTIASFVISPSNPTVPLGGTQQMHAFGTDSEGQPTGDITNKITWSSLAPGTISVSPSGLLSGKALSTSTVEIDANYQALAQQSTNATVCVEGASNLVIAPANSTDSNGATSQQFSASVTASIGGAPPAPLDVTAAVQWTTNNTTVVTIANGTGLATIAPPASTSPNAVVLITATYTCNGTALTGTTNFTVNHL
jgi:hypothetical protein